MSRHSIILQAAKPEIGEGLLFSRYLDEAAEGFIRFWLGRRAPQIVAKAYIQPNNDYSYQNVVFAVHDQVIVGMASGFTGEQHRRFSDRPLKRAAGFPALRMRAVRVLSAPIMRIISTVADSDFYLLALAVDSEMRGEGVGSTLMDSIEEQARAVGSARLTLDVSAKNKGARRLYERRGMTVESEWPALAFIPPLFVRMTKRL